MQGRISLPHFGQLPSTRCVDMNFAAICAQIGQLLCRYFRCMEYVPGLPEDPSLLITQVAPQPVQTAPGRTLAETGGVSVTAQPAKSAADNERSQNFFITRPISLHAREHTMGTPPQ